MYKFSYYRFDEVKPQKGSSEGYDLVRQSVIGKKNIKLRHFSEAYTTENWIVRIFSVNEFPNREISIKSRFKAKSVKFLPGVEQYFKTKRPRSDWIVFENYFK